MPGKYESTDPEGVSPKVLWPFLLAVVLTALAGTLSAVTPETLKDLGPYAVPVAMGLLAAGQFITGYMKKDPVREEVRETRAELKELTQQLHHADPPADGTAL